MSVNERQSQILDILRSNGSASVSDLSRRFDVSTETIRRDFRYLEDMGILIRSYGGAVFNEPLASTERMQAKERQQCNLQEKKYIGQLASRFIKPGLSICCDAATTVLELMHSVSDQADLVVMTNNIIPLSETEDSAYSLISTGGKANRLSQYLTGPIATQTISQYHFDYCFIGAQGIDQDGRLFDSDESETDVKQIYLKSAEKKCLLVDHTKFNKRAFKCWATLQDFDYLITDRKPEQTWIDLCAANDIQLIYE